MMEEGMMESEEGSEESSNGEVTTDIAILAGKKAGPGDRVTLEIVSVDEDMGSVTLRYPKSEAAPRRGIDEMAAEFESEEEA